jgi:hypothetical protein
MPFFLFLFHPVRIIISLVELGKASRRTFSRMGAHLHLPDRNSPEVHSCDSTKSPNTRLGKPWRRAYQWPFMQLVGYDSGLEVNGHRKKGNDGRQTEIGMPEGIPMREENSDILH